MEARLGENLGPYRLLELLGEGGMGRVYLAEDPRLGRQVALKLLPSEMAERPERLQRFEREARAVAALNHPSIVTIHSIEEVEGLRFLTMERVQGQTLTRVIPEHGLPLERFFPLATQIADALSAAHQAGITHRDLKPDNVMVSPDGRVKILDFGLAKLRQPESDELDLSEGDTASVTRDGRIVGTVAYMSPEQAQGKPVDSRSDIFSLGILLYEMATGRRPFTGDTNITVLSSILKDSPSPVSQLKAELPRPLARIIARALEKDPRDRYQSALDLRKDLEELRRDVESGELLASRHSLPSLLAPGAGRSWLPVGVATAVLALVALAYGLATRDAPPAPGAGRTATLAEADPRPSLAVFRFQNLSRDPELDWLGSGLTDMLVTDLSQSPGLRVLDTARLQQILSEAGAAADGQPAFALVQAVAREAEIGTAIVGSFMRAGEKLRISARLQDTATGEVIASESVEGAGGAELFGLVDELTERIRSRFEAARASAELDRDLKEVTTSSLQAYRAFVEGMRLHDRLDEEEALPHLERAVELDPGFAIAMAKLSVVHGNLGHAEESRRYARQALEHVERLSDRERLYIEGRYYSLDPATMDRAVAAYSEAVEKFPDHTAARNNLAQALMGLGNYSEAVRQLEELRRRGMTFPGTYESLAKARAALGEPDQGLEVLEDYARRNAESPTARIYLANFLVGLGRFDRAEVELTRALSLGADSAEVTRTRWMAAILAGKLDEAADHAERIADHEPVLGHALRGLVSAWRGDVDRAVSDLVAALDEPGSAKYDLLLLPPDLMLETGRPREALRLLDARPAQPNPTSPFSELYWRALRALALARLGEREAQASEAAAVRAGLDAMPEPLMPGIRANLRAFLALADGREADARHLFEESFSRFRSDPMSWDSLPALTASALADLERKAGSAAAERVWLERLEAIGTGRLTTPVAWVRGQYRLAELMDAAGDGAAAARRYQTFLRYWQDGELDRDRVERARARLAALGANATG